MAEWGGEPFPAVPVLDAAQDADFELWEELRPQIVAALEAKLQDGEPPS